MKRKDSIPLDGYRTVKIPPYFVIPSRYLPASLLSSKLARFLQLQLRAKALGADDWPLCYMARFHDNVVSVLGLGALVLGSTLSQRRDIGRES